MPDETEPNAEPNPITTAETIDALLASSAARAQQSFTAHVALGQRAMRRLVDPDSVEGSIADDYQATLGLMARDTMLAIDTFSRLLFLSSKTNGS